ncbi:polyprenyl synthetase family protein [Streptomyces globisporus]|uniref:polyprenyl synthetase family protein n=1 Tax=Streptomyces globisporus TaxID=1908 RepID=UPI00140540B1|nr:polyprenyl synthetase family protein [Streptomyces globisporus]
MELTIGGLTVGAVDEVLRSAGDACEGQLRRWVGSLQGPAAEVAAYQFGWSGEGARQGGKYVRAALTLACARAVGGVDRRAVPAAAAVEMVHNLSLLYDDVLDGDTVRRHRAAAWQIFGPSSAARSADAMMLTAFDVLSEADGPDGPVAREASAALVDVLIQLAVGESLDLVFEGRTEVTLAECLEMVSGKTASLFACACRLGALYGGADPAVCAQWAEFGHDLGMAFQLVDDLLGIWGDPAVTGKPVFNDLSNRKMSVPVVAALASATPAGDELARLYAQPGGDTAGLARLVEEAGGRAWTSDRAAQHATAARERLTRLTAVPEALHDLEALCTVVIRRVH